VRARRGLILFVVVGAVVAAIVLDHTQSSSNSANAQTSAPAVSPEPSVPAADALSTSWYCAEGTSTPDGRAPETIIVGNIGTTSVDATVTVMPGGNAAPVSEHITVRPRAERTVPVSEVLATAEPGVVVEVVGGQAIVEHQLGGQGDTAVAPCARAAAPDWYFANGTTVKGAQQYLVLFNPFGDDAIVDATLLTDTGVQQPDALQAVVVPRRSRVSLPLHTILERQTLVAAHVHARVGRVVAERSLFFDGTVSDGVPTRQGISVSLGATAPDTSWTFPFALQGDQLSQSLAIANFGNVPTSVSVTVQLDSDQTLVPQKVDIGAQSVVTIDPATHVPAGSQAMVIVQATDAEGATPPVVAELLAWWPSGASGPSVASSVGLVHTARRWVFALPPGVQDGQVTVQNPGAKPATAALVAYQAGDVNGPSSEPEVALPAARFGTFDIGGDGGRVLVITSDQPVSVGVRVTGGSGGGASLAPAVPDFGYRG
jgi:hypothetical protein